MNKVQSFLKEYNLEDLESKFVKLKKLYLDNLRDNYLNDENLIDAHVLFQLVKINSMNNRSKNNPYKINKQVIVNYFDINNEKLLRLNYGCYDFFSDIGFHNTQEYMTKYGLDAYEKKLVNGAKKLAREFKKAFTDGEVYHKHKNITIYYCPYNMDTFFFEKLHHAFNIEEIEIKFSDVDWSDELLFISYNNKDDYWTRYYLLYSSLLHNPFNIDSALEIARMYHFENAKRDSLMDYLINYCEQYYEDGGGDFQIIATKPYLRVLHQRALWLLEEDKIEEAKKYLYKCLEVRYSDPMGVRFILEEIDPDFVYLDPYDDDGFVS